MSGAVLHRFKSRYGDERRLIAVDSTTLLIEGPSRYTRGSTDDDGQVMADFEGGPFLMRGMTVEQCTTHRLTRFALARRWARAVDARRTPSLKSWK